MKKKWRTPFLQGHPFVPLLFSSVLNKRWGVDIKTNQPTSKQTSKLKESNSRQHI